MWWDVMGMDRQELSDMAGSASFVVWLFAQSPQLLENYHNSSCEGLSIVFLAQWMAGDVTNLVGCLLTQQLPFQIAVATYFCCIDLCILVQYYFYWHRDRLLERQTGSVHRRREYGQYSSTTVPNMRSSSTHASLSRPGHRSASGSPSTSIYRGVSSSNNKSSRPPLHLYQYSYDSNHSYRALSETARSVADLANEFARRVAVRDASRQERLRRKGMYSDAERAKGKAAERKQNASSGEEEEGDDADAPVKMMNSILSTGSRSSEEFGYGFGTASTTLQTKDRPEQKETVPPSPNSDKRGRDMTRTAGKILALSSSRSPNDPSGMAKAPTGHGDVLHALRMTSTPLEGSDSFQAGTSRPSISRSTTRTNNSGRSTRSPAASRGAGIVLLGLTMLFGMQNRRDTTATATTSVSQAVTMGKAYAVPVWQEHSQIAVPRDPVASSPRLTLFYAPNVHSHGQDRFHGRHPPPPSWERVIGRISAWVCTVLYMTSRLPQIWTNMSRTSVQGLSILLFVSAALGNGLYSASVLINPLASGDTRHDYLRESLPFLLGSGGTLIFDAVIVLQWIAWRGKAPSVEVIHHHHPFPPASFTYRGSSRTGGGGGGISNSNDPLRRQWSSLERQPLLE